MPEGGVRDCMTQHDDPIGNWEHRQGERQDVVRASNARGRENQETGETVTLMEELYSTFLADIDYVFILVKHSIFLYMCDRENNCAHP